MSPYDDGWMADTFECLAVELQLNHPQRESLGRVVLVEHPLDLSDQHLVIPASESALSFGEVEKRDERSAISRHPHVRLDRARRSGG